MISQQVLHDALDIQQHFNDAKPFRYVEINNFLDAEKCEMLMRDFPAFQEKFAVNEQGEVGAKAVIERVSGISPFYKKFYSYINTRKFLDAVTDLTGIPDLIADETLFGGGTHENRHGQSLDVHIDFNIDERRMLHRRLNLLIYLNPEWDAAWGGLIELHSNPWDQSVNEKKSFLPLFNKAIIFETNEYSWHGFERIQLPESQRHLSRKSFSIYLYTKDRPPEEVVAPHTTFYVPAPLPAYLHAGHTITAEDQTQLQILITGRDGLLKMYQKLLIEKEQRLRDFMKSRQVIIDSTYIAGGGGKLESVRDCPVCGADGNTTTWIGQLENTSHAIFQQEAYDLAQCGTCALVYLSPEPSAADLKTLYVDSAQFDGDTYTDTARIEAISSYMTQCLTRVLNFQQLAQDATIASLEIGAGLAWMSRSAKSLQPQSRTVAQDVSPEAKDKCPWVDSYIQGDISNRTITAGSPYNIISMTHVIEHLVDPVDMIKRCHGLLAKNGIIFITAPHRPVGWREYSRNILPWKKSSYNHVPAHIQYFSEKSMQKLATVCGYRVVHWNAQHEKGQAFEAWITPIENSVIPSTSSLRGLVRRMIRKLKK